jgi:hypothetical protein
LFYHCLAVFIRVCGLLLFGRCDFEIGLKGLRQG